jgi:hypothetical protein
MGAPESGGSRRRTRPSALSGVVEERLVSSEKKVVVWSVVGKRGPKKVSRTLGPGPTYTLEAKTLIDLKC